jgi:hypothetical protein
LKKPNNWKFTYIALWSKIARRFRIVKTNTNSKKIFRVMGQIVLASNYFHSKTYSKPLSSMSAEAQYNCRHNIPLPVQYYAANSSILNFLSITRRVGLPKWQTSYWSYLYRNSIWNFSLNINEFSIMTTRTSHFRGELCFRRNFLLNENILIVIVKLEELRDILLDNRLNKKNTYSIQCLSFCISS